MLKRFVSNYCLVLVALLLGLPFLVSTCTLSQTQDRNYLDRQKIQGIRLGMTTEEAMNEKFFCALLANSANTAAEVRGAKTPEEMEALRQKIAEAFADKPGIVKAFQEAVRFGYQSSYTPDEVFIMVVEACLAPKE